jgi:hypothetical protein
MGGEQLSLFPAQPAGKFTKLEDFIELADGQSGDVMVEKAFLTQVFSAWKVFQERQKKYGRGNIAKFGQRGVMVRVSDKVERLINLLARVGSGVITDNFKDESVADTWLDIANYGLIGMMCYAGTWPKAPK